MPQTRAILICNPGNPTGNLYPRESLEKLKEIVLKHDLFLIADDVYREFVYDSLQHHSTLGLSGIENNVVVVDSISKRFSACGARIRCVISRNKELMQSVLKLSQARLSPPTYGQIDAQAVNGAFYAMVRLPVDSAEKFCRWMLEEFEINGATVMMAPGEGFYASPGCGVDEVRIAYVLNQTDLAAAMKCLEEGLLAYPGRKSTRQNLRRMFNRLLRN